MNLKYTLIGGMALSALTSPALADSTDFSFPIHDIIVTSNIPTVNIAVRNISNSTDPEDRDLRVVSQTPVIPVSGQVWCKLYDNAEANATRAQIMFGNVIVHAGQNGSEIFPLGPYSLSEIDSFNGTHNLENFQIDAAFEFPDSYDRDLLVDFTPFNPVRTVEQRLEQYVENGAGSEADFLRVDDVFQLQVTLNAVGWCEYESQNTSGEYAGARGVPMTVTIFYHGDPDIQDVIGTVGGASTITAPPPNRARASTRTRGGASTPPARNSRPARAEDDQRAARGGVRVAVGDINNDGREKPGILTEKQQQARGRTRSRATVDGAASSAADPLDDGTDTDSDGVQTSTQYPYRLEVAPAEPQAGLIVPAVQRVRESRSSSANAAPGQSRRRGGAVVEDVRDTRDGQAAPLDALLVINEAAGGGGAQETEGLEPDEIDAPAQARAGVEPDEIDAPAQAADAEPRDAFMHLRLGRNRDR
ncbi:hypothetical protein [Hyphobacterium sp.]|uniref:hypothetical protein n=1 Tax=Hyphobacterium sp. TaxID=2004662 RepID=UPI003B529A28